MSHQNAEAEKAFRLLAAMIDEVGQEKTPLFLSKLSLILAHELNDHSRFQNAVTRAMRSQADALDQGTTSAASGGGAV